MLWEQGGKLLENATGLIDCDVCPCGVSPFCEICTGQAAAIYKIICEGFADTGGNCPAAACEDLNGEFLLSYVGRFDGAGNPDPAGEWAAWESDSFSAAPSCAAPGDLDNRKWVMAIGPTVPGDPSTCEVRLLLTKDGGSWFDFGYHTYSVWSRTGGAGTWDCATELEFTPAHYLYGSPDCNFDQAGTAIALMAV